jgi:hypothetical protein
MGFEPTVSVSKWSWPTPQTTWTLGPAERRITGKERFQQKNLKANNKQCLHVCYVSLNQVCKHYTTDDGPVRAEMHLAINKSQQ